MIKKLLLIVVVIIPTGIYAQESHNAGRFELGMRQTFSAFGAEEGAGLGTGGQFRLMLGKRLNTEWFADYIQTDLYKLGKRNDAHIGWSVMFYLLSEKKKLEPYLLAGHCFDYTRVTVFSTLVDNRKDETTKRWSSAAQAGLGTHYHLSETFDLSLSAQYMVHLGNDIHTNLIETNGVEYLEIEQTSTNNKLTFEGHVLFTLSLNVKIADLW